jgi:tRNA dimethylallyltransferase
MRSKRESVLLIAGPTASGKSALAIAEAQARGGVIINADSMQVYEELRIITARPTNADLSMAPHRLYGHVSAREDYSVGRWLTDARREIESCWSAGQLPIVCGGTGLYFKALTDGLAAVPAIPQHVRDKWRAFEGSLHEELQHLDPRMAAKLNPADRQRLLRALEVADATGVSLLDWQERGRGSAFLNDINVERIYLDIPREVLYARAEQRFDQMMEQGAYEEVSRLPPLAATSPLMKAIGVPELLALKDGILNKGQAITNAKTATRNYIKRQLTWWRGQMREWSSRMT